jgi:hypothetical protein
MKKIIPFLLLALLVKSSIAQSPVIDSLQKSVLKYHLPDTHRVNLLNALAYELRVDSIKMTRTLASVCLQMK